MIETPSCHDRSRAKVLQARPRRQVFCQMNPGTRNAPTPALLGAVRGRNACLPRPSRHRQRITGSAPSSRPAERKLLRTETMFRHRPAQSRSARGAEAGAFCGAVTWQRIAAPILHAAISATGDLPNEPGQQDRPEPRVGPQNRGAVPLRTSVWRPPANHELLIGVRHAPIVTTSSTSRFSAAGATKDGELVEASPPSAVGSHLLSRQSGDHLRAVPS